MPKFLEQKLKAEYPNNPRAVYGTLNNIGAMKGNKETPKGAAMQAKHDAKVVKSPMRPMPPMQPSSQFPHRNLGTFLHAKKGR